MLACALALLMAVEVQHEFVSMKDMNIRLEARLNDGWEIVFSNFVLASPGHLNQEARMLFIFKRGTP